MRAIWFVVLTGCAGAEAMALPPQPAVVTPAPSPGTEFGFYPGETMAFEVHLAGMLAGEAQLAVGQVGELEGHKAVVVKSRVATAGAARLFKNLTDEATTTIDTDSGRPLFLDTTVVLNDKTSTAHAVFTGSIANVTFTKPDDPAPHSYRVDFGKVTVHDSHSAMAQMRGWRPVAGTTKQVYVVGGKRLWRVDVKFVGAETIGSAVGNRPTVHLSGSAFRAKPNLQLEQAAATRTFDVWISDDADRVPLKMTAHTELGDVQMDLTEYARP
ncbi:hypothetical protein BH11MYX1_BH11MYX1_42420 [soil metagenome]